MTNVLDVSGPAAMLLLGLPVAVLVVLIVRAVRSRTISARTLPGTLPDEVAALPGASPTFGALDRSHEPELPRPRHTEETPPPSERSEPAKPAMQEPEAIKPAVSLRESAGEAPSSEHRLASEIRGAEAANDQARLAGLYLAAALGDLDAGRTGSAAEHLRKSIRSAVKTRNAPVHARARVELAELARAAGDLTTACEHWQIARALFSEMRDTEALEGAEALMQQHGCPTDWVLNDF